MIKTVEQLLEIIEEEEIRLRKLDLPITMTKNSLGAYKENDFNLSKESLQSFLLDFFYWNNLYLYDSASYRKGKNALVATCQQKNENEGPCYCYAGARRSIGDLFRLAVKYYDKDVTLLETMKEMFNIVQNDITYKCKEHPTNYGSVYMQVCGTINRRVFCGHIGLRSGYKFSGSYNTTTDHLHEEFPKCAILGTDYVALFGTAIGKKLVEEVLNPVVKMDPKDLDKLVMEKLAKLRGMNKTQISRPQKYASLYSVEDMEF